MIDPKALIASVVVGVAVLLGLHAGRRSPDHPWRDPGVEANARLTGYAGVFLLVPLAAEIVTGVRPGLSAHALIGFLIVPPLLLKLGSVAYRFIRYYGGDPRYRLAGPPRPIARVVGPIVVILTVVLFATGVVVWLFGFRFGDQWLTWHKLAFALWFPAMTVHVVAYLHRAPALVIADSRDGLRGVFGRRSLVIASVLLGVALAIAMAPFPSPFVLTPDAG